MNEQLLPWLAARLAQPLPGPMVGSRFEPHPRPWRHYDVGRRRTPGPPRSWCCSIRTKASGICP